MTETKPLAIAFLLRLDREGPPRYVGGLSNGMWWFFCVYAGDALFGIGDLDQVRDGAMGGKVECAFIRRIPVSPRERLSEWAAQTMIARWIHEFAAVPTVSIEVHRLRPRTFLGRLNKYPGLWGHNYLQLRKVLSPIGAAYYATRYSMMIVRPSRAVRK